MVPNKMSSFIFFVCGLAIGWSLTSYYFASQMEKVKPKQPIGFKFPPQR